MSNKKSALQTVGEFGLIHRLEQRIAKRRAQTFAGLPLAVGISDDAAVWKSAAGYELSKTDTMVEEVHFTRQTATWQDVGWKVMVANQSDMAAMGGEPTYILVTLGLPPDLGVAAIEALYDGLLDACDAHGGRIVGGDIVRSSVFFVTISMNGIAKGPLLLRTNAKPGHQVAVTGTLGGAEGGLRLLLNQHTADNQNREALKKAHFHRTPRIPDAKVLVASGVRSAIDISDGVLADLGKLCAASGVAARLNADALPLHPALRKAFPKDARAMALASGEEYELLFTAPAAVMKKALPKLPTGGTVIGEITSGKAGDVQVVDAKGNSIKVPAAGWDHFRS